MVRGASGALAAGSGVSARDVRAAHPVSIQIPVTMGHALQTRVVAQAVPFDWTPALFALWRAGLRADHLLSRGDVQGSNVWKLIVKAIQELQKDTPDSSMLH